MFCVCRLNFNSFNTVRYLEEVVHLSFFGFVFCSRRKRFWKKINLIDVYQI